MRNKRIVGRVNDLTSSQYNRLNRLRTRRLGSEEFLPRDVARSMAEVSTELNRAVGLLVNRRGGVEWVAVGTFDTVYLPEIGRGRAGQTRLRGLRWLVVLPSRLGHPLKRDLEFPRDLRTDTERLQLDATVVFEGFAGNQIGKTALIHVNPQSEERSEVLYLRDVNLLPESFSVWIDELETEVGRSRSSRLKASAARDTAVIVGVYDKGDTAAEDRLLELEELCKTAGVSIAGRFIQRRARPDPRTLVGRGKLESICLEALHFGCDLLIFDRELAPSQLNAVTDLTDLRVIDRTMLIMDIFAQHAVSRSGKLQVELAQCQYSLPRLAKKQSGLSRLTGGIGGQGPGETKLEVDRRRVRDRITKLEREIDRLGQQRQARRRNRERNKVPVVALIGYTNVGKSTLLNLLTGSEVLAENKLFATLDPTVRRIRFPMERELVLVDTVGFIRDLPKGLQNAFRATLEEVAASDLLIHVADATDPLVKDRQASVLKVLDGIGADHVQELVVYNKVDGLQVDERERMENAARREGALTLSAATGEGKDALVTRILEIVFQQSNHGPQPSPHHGSYL